jgi:hypothetical protein
MMPMFFPYGNANTAGQQFYAPAVYPNVPTYPSNGAQRHGNFGLSYNTFYAPFYPAQNNILSSATHITNSTALIPPRPLMVPPFLPLQQQRQQQRSSASSSIIGNDTERNKNLNIRECQSPVLNQTKKEKKPLQIVDPNDINTDLRIRKDSSSTSSLLSQSGKTILKITKNILFYLFVFRIRSKSTCSFVFFFCSGNRFRYSTR